MKKIVNSKYRETYYEDTMDNGLKVVLWHKPDYEKSLFMMATPLGAMDLRQRDEQGKSYEFPAGIAHFLEHKMFEMGDKDVMDVFSQLGANVNAFTSYSETAYYFSTSQDYKKPLALLLDFVQQLDISEASIEKEKGIIIQELNMYKQMSDQRLLMETFSSLYAEHPLKYDIGGDAQSVSGITKKQLEECYAINYHPSTMVLIGVTSHDPDEVLSVIRKNQKKKKFAPAPKVMTVYVDEPEEVARKKYVFSMEVSVPKICIAYKLGGISDVRERIRQEWCIKIMLDAYFSSINEDYQSWIDDEIINDYFGSEVDYGENYGSVLIYSETEKQEAFEELVYNGVQSIAQAKLSEDVLQQLKRRYYGQTLRSLNSFDDIAISFVRSYFDGSDFFQSMEILDAITMSDIEKACESLADAPFAEVIVQPKYQNK
ncbi:MAG: insulinase family protein [Erysipelotrichaceae bacterium]|jgi:predicted Zn-dependent peptidase|nr:insulinase family protein [Erysipelotrichaceae bacterium]